MGTAYLAGLAIGFWNINDIKKINKIEKEYKPIMTEKKQKLFIRVDKKQWGFYVICVSLFYKVLV